MSQPPPVDDRSAMAKAIGRASEASTVAFTIGICFIFGYWIDRSLGTTPLFSVIGLTLGMITAFLQLIKLAQRIGQPTSTEMRSQQPEASDNEESQSRQSK